MWGIPAVFQKKDQGTVNLALQPEPVLRHVVYLSGTSEHLPLKFPSDRVLDMLT